MSLYCENFRALLTTKTDDTRMLVRARCKQWSCAYCAQQNSKIWQARIIQHINNHDLQWSWFTLTAHSKRRTAENSLDNLRQAWDVLMKRIKRKYKHVGRIHYVRVFERHKSGAYHLHCIISLHWDDIRIRTSKTGVKTSYSAWLRDTAAELKLGWYTHAANFEGEHAGYIAGYVGKYMTKQLKEDSLRVRMIQASQGWTNEREESEYRWEIWRDYTIRDFSADLWHNRKVKDLSAQIEVTYDNFLDSDIYPPTNSVG